MTNQYKKMKPRMIDIPSGPQGGLVYNPNPYESKLHPYRLQDLGKYARSVGKAPFELTKEELEQFRIPGR